MSDQLRLELAAMLDEYDATRRTEELRKQQVRDEERQFLESFARLRREVVRPMFETAGALLKERGHGFSIREQEFAPGPDGSPAEAMISLRITPAGMEGAAAADERLRELAFTTRHYNRAVSIVNGAVPQSGSQAGAQGTCALAQIDAHLVQDQVLKLMASLVRRS